MSSSLSHTAAPWRQNDVKQNEATASNDGGSSTQPYDTFLLQMPHHVESFDSADNIDLPVSVDDTSAENNSNNNDNSNNKEIWSSTKSGGWDFAPSQSDIAFTPEKGSSIIGYRGVSTDEYNSAGKSFSNTGNYYNNATGGQWDNYNTYASNAGGSAAATTTTTTSGNIWGQESTPSSYTNNVSQEDSFASHLAQLNLNSSHNQYHSEQKSSHADNYYDKDNERNKQVASPYAPIGAQRNYHNDNMSVQSSVPGLVAASSGSTMSWNTKPTIASHTDDAYYSGGGGGGYHAASVNGYGAPTSPQSLSHTVDEYSYSSAPFHAEYMASPEYSSNSAVVSPSSAGNGRNYYQHGFSENSYDADYHGSVKNSGRRGRNKPRGRSNHKSALQKVPYASPAAYNKAWNPASPTSEPQFYGAKDVNAGAASSLSSLSPWQTSKANKSVIVSDAVADDDNNTASSSQAIRQLMQPSSDVLSPTSQSSNNSGSKACYSPLNGINSSDSTVETTGTCESFPILPLQPPVVLEEFLIDVTDTDWSSQHNKHTSPSGSNLASDSHDNGDCDSKAASSTPVSKKKEWLARMNRKLQDTPVGEIDPTIIPVAAVMNSWAKTKSTQGATMVEMWLDRVQQEYDSGNKRVTPTTKMYTMAVDAWARSGDGGAAAQRAEGLLQRMNKLYTSSGNAALKPTTGIFNAVINAWARSREKIAPTRAEQILEWMQNLNDKEVQPDKYTFNTVIHAYAKAGGTEAALKAQELLTQMHQLYQNGNASAKPDTITYNVVINCWAKSGGKGAAGEAEKLLNRMHSLYEMGDTDVKPNVVTYGAVIDSFAKCGERGAAARADTLLANMIRLHQSDPIKHADLMPNTYVFNTVINCWAKSKEHDAASKAEEMLVAMGRLHASGMPSLKPDAFTYTAVIDAWAKSGYKGAATRADQLLDKMEAKYLDGDMDLKPNTFTYNAVINALAKSGEPGAAARAERVLQNMVNRHRAGGEDDVKPTTINFNTVLDAWAKSGGGRAAAERAEEILEWMDHLHKQGNSEVKPDTITFNAVIDAWARSGDRVAPRRAEQILDHMDELYRAGNKGVKPDTYTYNTLINAWAKSSERGAAARAEHVLSVMEKRYRDGDRDFKPNTRTHTSVIDAWAKSGEKGAARRAEQMLNQMIQTYETTGDTDVKPNVHTANAVCNACAFSKHEEDKQEALQIAFRVFDWLSTQHDKSPDSYTYTILLSVCANLIPRHDTASRYAHARSFFDSCREAGYVNDYVLRKLRQTVNEDEFYEILEYRNETNAASMPASWTRNTKVGFAGNNNRGKNNYRRKRN